MLKNIFNVILIIILFCLFFNCSTYPYEKQKAVNIAKNYLSEKYEQDMKYLFTYAPLPILALDRGKYYEVYFSPINDDKIRFEVIISDDLSAVTRDYYLVTRFEVFSQSYFQEKMKNIWKDNNMRVWFWINNKGDFYRNNSIDINENTNTEEFKYYVGIYNIIIIVDYILNNTIVEDEASKILQAISIIKEKNYEPDHIEIWYNNSKEISYERHQHIVLYKMSNNELPLWNTINTEQELIEILNNELNR